MIVVGFCGSAKFVEALMIQIDMPIVKHATRIAVMEFAIGPRTVS